MINQNGKKMKKNKYICITESLCCTAEIITTLQINYTSIKLVKIFLKDGGRERAFKEGCLAQAETQRQGHRRNLQETVGSTIWLGKTSSWPRLEKGVLISASLCPCVSASLSLCLCLSLAPSLSLPLHLCCPVLHPPPHLPGEWGRLSGIQTQ